MNPILIVDENEQIVEILSRYIAAEGWPLLCARSGEEALSLFDAADPSVILLDILLPGIDGLEVCRRIRRVSGVPILMITARDEDADRILGLDIGADDYITKPFNPVEVCARVRSHLRRYFSLGGGNVKPETFVCGGIELNDASKKVTVDGEPVTLTPKEYDILRLLLSEQGRVFSPKEIYKRVWNDIPLNSDNTVAVHIRHLREKIEINPSEPRYLKVLFGQGYMIEKVRDR